jgi:hypothetical protein
VATDDPEFNRAALARREREKDENRRLTLQALELRKNGMSFREIAEIQHCNPQTAARRYRKGCKQYLPQELVESARATELDRFDALTQINISLIAEAYKARDIDTLLKLEDRTLAIHDRRKKLIPMEVPTTIKLDQTIETVTDQDRELAAFLDQHEAEVEAEIRRIRETAAP